MPEILHQGPITACALDGRGRAVTGSVEGDLRLWDFESRTCTGRLSTHQGPVLAIAWSGERLISAGHDGRIVVQGADGAMRREWMAHPGGAAALAVAPEGLVSGGHDGAIRYWTATGDPEGIVVGRHEDRVTHLDILPDGALVSGGRDDAVRFWNLAERRQIAIGLGHRLWVTRVAALPDGRAVSVSEDGMMRLWDVAGAELASIAAGRGSPIWGLTVADGLPIVGFGGGTRAFATESGFVPAALKSALTCRAMAANGRRFLLGADNGELLFGEDGAIAGEAKTGIPGPLSLAAWRAPSGVHALIGRSDGAVLFDDGARRELAPAHDHFTFAAHTLASGLFASGAFDGRLKLWRARDGGFVGEMSHAPAFIFSLASDAAGKRLLAAGGEAVSLWDVDEQALLWRDDDPALGIHVFAALSPDGRRMAAVTEGGRLRLWRLGDGAVIETRRDLHLDVRLCTAIAMLPEPETAVVTTADGGVHRLDLINGQTRRLYDGLGAFPRTLRVSPDGRRILAASEWGVAAVVDAETGADLTPPALSGAVAPAAAFADDGTLVFVDGLGELHVL